MENEKQHIRKTLLVAITSGATNLMSMTIYPHFKDRFTYLAIEKQEGSVSFLSHNDFTFDSLVFTTFGDFPDIEKRLLSYMDRFEEIILLSCLGRPVNAELTIRLAHFFSFQKKKVILVATLPFAFEGKERITESLSVIKKMRTFPIILRLSIGERFLEGRDLDSLPFGEILEKVGEDIITLLEGICGNTNESDSQSLDEQIEYIEAYRDVAVSKAQSIRKYVEELAYGNTIFPTDTKISSVDILTDDGENQSKPLEEYCDVYEIGWGYYNEKRYNQAVHQLMPLAKNKDKVAQFLVGLSLLKLGDEHSAQVWFRRAANQGEKAAKFYVGYLYAFGEHITHQYDKALNYLQDVAEDGDADAQFLTAWLYEGGLGISKDMKKARKWYQQAAKQKHPFTVQRLDTFIEPISWELIISFLAVDLLLLLSFFTGWDLVSFIILNICVVTLFCSWVSRRKKCNRKRWNKNMRLLIWNKTV